MTATIYALIDPRDARVRYVGMTRLHLEVRLHGHIRDRAASWCRKTNRLLPSPKCAWIAELAVAGLVPQIVAIESATVASVSDARRLEVEWIDRLLARGAGLINRRRATVCTRCKQPIPEA